MAELNRCAETVQGLDGQHREVNMLVDELRQFANNFGQYTTLFPGADSSLDEDDQALARAFGTSRWPVKDLLNYIADMTEV